jgi:NDP-sugar pyrophosphorylase family protein
MKGMILAAGLGTRLKPWTDHHPKALAVVNGKSLLQRNIEYLQHFGIKEVIVNVHHFAGQIIEAIDKNQGWGSNITISDETGEILETGGGLKKASWYLQGETCFVLMNVDILTDLNVTAMIQQHQNSTAIATLAVTERNTSRYFLFNAKSELCGWRNINTNEEKIVRPSADLHQKAFSGIHVISGAIFQHLSRQGKFSMVDAYLDLAKHHFIQGFDHSETNFIDVGKPESIEKAEKLFG